MGYKELTQQDIRLQEQLLAKYQAALEKLPEGLLTYKIIRGKLRYYQIDPVTGTQHYLNNSDQKKIQDLKYKKFLEASMKQMQCNLKHQKKVLQHYGDYSPAAIEKGLPKGYRDAALQIFSKANPVPRQSESDYYPEGLIHQTSFGMYLRSKGEVLIAELLHYAGIPFFSEPKLRLQCIDGSWVTYRPDFEIPLPLGDSFYWEHAGLLQKPEYREHFFKKLADYHHNQIFIPKNLIVTMDGPDGTIDAAAINGIIHGLLLPHFQSESSF